VAERRRCHRWGALGALFSVVAASSGAIGFVALTPACQDRACLGGTADYGARPGEGNLITPDLWETTAAEAKWVRYPAQQVWFIHPQGMAQRHYSRITVYISPVEEPNTGGQQYTIASGNVAVVTQLGDMIVVHNDTCADFFFRVVAEAYPLPDAGPTDAANDGEVGTSDAVHDGAADAPTDAITDGASE
jgi:hypothetical protein